jgi:flagellin-like protein
MFTHKSEKGITGLETAIILIAFVVGEELDRTTWFGYCLQGPS